MQFIKRAISKQVKKQLKAKILVIYNPHAGIQKKTIHKVKEIIINKELEQQIVEEFKSYEVKLLVTKKKLDATKYVKKYSSYEIVIAAGGDGTINEVINGISENQTLGIIPLGSENVLAKELKLSLKLKEACNIIKRNKRQKIDIGIANKKRFIFVTGIGIDAHAITKVKPQIKKLLGRHSYTIAGLQTLFQHKPELLKINIDNKIIETGYFVLATNLKHYGGNIKIAPKAKLNDNYLDICIFKYKDPISIIKYFLTAAVGQLEITRYKAKTAQIISEKKVLYHTDAEVGGTTPVNISLEKFQLNIIVP